MKFTDYGLVENSTNFTISKPIITIVVDKETGGISYSDRSCAVYLSEPERGGKWLTKKQVYRTPSNQYTFNGGRAQDTARDVFEAKLEFVFNAKEAIFGLGSHEEGYSYLRG